MCETAARLALDAWHPIEFRPHGSLRMKESLPGIARALSAFRRWQHAELRGSGPRLLYLTPSATASDRPVRSAFPAPRTPATGPRPSEAPVAPWRSITLSCLILRRLLHIGCRLLNGTDVIPSKILSKQCLAPRSKVQIGLIGRRASRNNTDAGSGMLRVYNNYRSRQAC